MDAKQIGLLTGDGGAFCTVCDCLPSEGRSLDHVMLRFTPNRSLVESRALYDAFVQVNEAGEEYIDKK